MRRIVILSAVAAVVLSAAFLVVRGETRGRNGWCRHGHSGPVSYLVHELKLSDAQTAQIRLLWRAERPAFSTHVQELLAENKDMNAIAASNNPDGSEVRRIADREANTIAALLVEKTQLESKTYSTVLTPEQRVKADALQEKWESRLDRLAGHLATQSTEK